MRDVRYVTVGKITSTHGNKGMLKVKPLTDFPERFFSMAKVYVYNENGRDVLHIEEVQGHHNNLIVQFREITNLGEAEKYKGALLQVHRDQVVRLPEDTYYIFEIIGCKVYDVKGEFWGEIKEVIQTGANDVYVVEKEDRSKPLLLPALKSIVRSVDVQARRLEVDLPAGLDD